MLQKGKTLLKQFVHQPAHIDMNRHIFNGGILAQVVQNMAKSFHQIFRVFVHAKKAMQLTKA